MALKTHLLIVIEGTRLAGERECENRLELSSGLILWRRQLSTSAVILSPLPLTKLLHSTRLLTSLLLPGNTAHPLCNLLSIQAHLFQVFVSYTTPQCHEINVNLLSCCLSSWQDYALSRGYTGHSYFWSLPVSVPVNLAVQAFIELFWETDFSPQTFPFSVIAFSGTSLFWVVCCAQASINKLNILPPFLVFLCLWLFVRGFHSRIDAYLCFHPAGLIANSILHSEGVIGGQIVG